MTDAPACRIRLHPPEHRGAAIEPFTTGIALPKGWCREASALRLTDAAGAPTPLQHRVLERWSDQSIRWVLLDFQARATAGASVWLRLADTASAPVPPPAPAIIVHPSAGGATVDTGAATFELSAGAASPFTSVTIAGAPRLDPQGTQFLVQGPGGQRWPVVFDAIEVEDSGPLRAAIVARGRVQADVALGLTCRIELFAGSPAARIRVTLHNPRAATHAGGFWELGDPGSVLLARVALEVGRRNAERAEVIRASIERGAPIERLAAPARIHQESSGTPQWQSAVHVNRDGRVPLRYAGYRVEAGAARRDGTHATPLVIVGDAEHAVGVTSRLFWEVFPKAYAVAPDGTLAIELLPEVGDLHELQGGERFTHELTIAFGVVDPSALDVFRSPSTVTLDPAWWAAAGDVKHLTPVVEPDAPYERLVRAAIDGDDSFARKRDRIDEYGWRHFGDLYADHENGAADRPPLVSHYNNQYDAIAGFIWQGMRSGDPRWWEPARDLATHVANVDIYWTDEDKSAYNGGLFWHTYHYVDAGRATHRCYPKAEGVAGGGPSVEQNYSSGLLLHHFLTGDPASREAVLRLARWTAEMDEGQRTVFRFLSSAPTGLASATGGVDYHGPGRGPANAIQTLLNAYRLTADREWIRRAEELITRCIHPRDDLAARNLLDAERRWYYTVFLQALGRYLAFKSEIGEEDTVWHYARASLLHYARWMAEHEYPYLEKPEILEYPTETWAAQDMRKCEVFDLAADYTPDAAERARFIERARKFFGASVGTLEQWGTRTWTRPVVLMLSYGYAHLAHEARRPLQALVPASPPIDFGAPPAFEPQKAIAMRRAKGLVIAAAITGAAALGTAISLLL